MMADAIGFWRVKAAIWPAKANPWLASRTYEAAKQRPTLGGAPLPRSLTG
jgi:hypothetical protein